MDSYRPFQRGGLLLALVAFDALLWVLILVLGYLIVRAA